QQAVEQRLSWTTDTQQQVLAQRQVLEARAQNLKQQEDAWARREQEMSRNGADIERQRQDLAKLKGTWEAEQAAALAEANNRKAAIDQAEASLRDQKAELVRMFNDLKGIQDELRKQPRGDAKA